MLAVRLATVVHAASSSQPETSLELLLPMIMRAMLLRPGHKVCDARIFNSYIALAHDLAHDHVAVGSSESAQSEDAPGGLPLHHPCCPGGDVHTFIEDIPIGDEIKKALFNALGTAGIETMKDLYTLMDLL